MKKFFATTAVLAFFISFISSYSTASVTISGKVADAGNGESLAFAHVSVIGQNEVTLTNGNGDYIITIPSIPATLEFSYIGYTSKQIIIDETSPETQNISLEANPFVLEPVIVTSGNPADRIIRRVIEEKQKWHAKLDTYKADAYTRVITENDTSIVAIEESASIVYYSQHHGIHEDILWKRQTENIGNLASSIWIPNFYDDTINIAGFDILGPTHPDALKHYDFRLVEQQFIDRTTVFKISVKPKRAYLNLFEGTVTVLDSAYALLNADLRLTESIELPQPEADPQTGKKWPYQLRKLTQSHEQHFACYDSDFWLPVSTTIKRSIEISAPGLRFPPIHRRFLTRFTGYEINTVLPDILFDKNDEEMVVLQNEPGTIERYSNNMIPLTPEEYRAYSVIDTTFTMTNVFEPEGPLKFFAKLYSQHEEQKKKDDEKAAEKGKLEDGKRKKSFTTAIVPQVGINRVDGIYPILTGKLKHNNGTSISLMFGKASASGRRKYGGGIRQTWGKSDRWHSSLSYKNSSEHLLKSKVYSENLNSIMFVLGRDEYFDYFKNERWNGEIGRNFITSGLSLSLGVNIEKHEYLPKRIDNQFLKKGHKQAENPRIYQGSLGSLSLYLSWKNDTGNGKSAWIKNINLKAEMADPSYFDTDFSFSHADVLIDGSIDTFFRGGAMPNRLKYRIDAGVGSNGLPVQRYGSIDSRFTAFSPFGALKTLDKGLVGGKHHLAIFAEHTFRTVPFDMLKIKWLTRNTEIALHGAYGRTWEGEMNTRYIVHLPESIENGHGEMGLTLHNVFKHFRVDISKHLDSSNYYFGVGVAKLY
ncbi:DUF5686 family protein [Candidatus Latescibacterota bacterium]